MTTSLSAGKSGRMMSTICREAFPPPRRLLTTSSGVISFGCSAASDGARHSANSHAVSALKVTALPVGRYTQYGNPSKTLARPPIFCEPVPQSTAQWPPRRTKAASSPSVRAVYVSPGARRRTDMLIHSQLTLSREKRSNSPDCPSARGREWTTFGKVLIHRLQVGRSGDLPTSPRLALLLSHQSALSVIRQIVWPDVRNQAEIGYSLDCLFANRLEFILKRPLFVNNAIVRKERCGGRDSAG